MSSGSFSKGNHILILDDDPAVIEGCSRVLSRMGCHCLTLQDLEGEREPFDVVLTDMGMPRDELLNALEHLKEQTPSATVVLFLTCPTVKAAIEAIKRGDFVPLNRPLHPGEIKAMFERLAPAEDQRPELKGGEQIVGTSPALIKVLKTIKKVAPSNANVLLLGESGTGKELMARTIHLNSARCDGPFIPVDCASLPETLLESELFGYEKGAFTGALSTRPGIFEYANGGTIFLDEVGELSPSLQAKLLRVLQERQFRRVGGRQLIQVDVRVISATNQDLIQAVRDGRFRKDLYYRLNVVPIHLPPLRERREDIKPLVRHFLRYFSQRDHRPVREISQAAMELLERYPWPGNVRELQNVMERAVSLAEGEVILPEDLPEEVRKGRVPSLEDEIPLDLPFEEAKERWIELFERRYLRELLERTGGNISQAARMAGVNRKTIHRLLKKHGLHKGRSFIP